MAGEIRAKNKNSANMRSEIDKLKIIIKELETDKSDIEEKIKDTEEKVGEIFVMQSVSKVKVRRLNIISYLLNFTY